MATTLPSTAPVGLSDPIEEIIAAMDNPVSVYDVPYVLMGRESGKDVTEIQHLIRCLIDLLTTPIGSMPTLREYGCRLHDYIDSPINSALKLDMLAAIFMAIDRWEPRLALEKIDVLAGDEVGQLFLTLQGRYLLEGRAITLHNLTLDFKKETALSENL